MIHAITYIMFHAFTGCDGVYYSEKGGGQVGKCRWHDVTEAFCDLPDKPSVISESINLLERFIVLLCDQTSNEHSVNKAR